MSSCCTRVRAVESHKVSPPPNSVSSPTLLPLTFSDAFWIPFSSNTQKLFIYNFPSISTSYFINSFLPTLKTSLSLSLRHFFPLAGSFTPPAHPTDRPCIRYEDGCFVPLTVAEATGDFSHLTDKRRLINATEFHPLVPDLCADDVTGRTSVLALQFTVFPDCGICFGITYKHVVADGKSISAFLSAWSSTCNNRCVLPPDTILPIIDRSLIPDPNGFWLDSYLKQIFSPAAEGKKPAAGPSEAKVRGTFVITRSEIEKLRQWVLKRAENENLHLSTFVLTCSLIWVNLIKSEAAVRKPNVDATDVCRFGQVVDCRDRYEFKSIVPSAYFGNCLAYGCFALAKRTELEGEDGFVVAVRAMGNRIKKLEEEGALTEAQSWLADFFDISSTGSVFTVAGSPRLGVYGLEFGWGRPDRVEVVSIDSSSSISIAECVDGEGGVEIGLALDMPQMQAFVSIHEESKYILCRSY